ncbi:hypothetical protein [Streptomyces misionensis]|uniref:hypothetical protein n=1 Tax=Streptomyces misionensis TaxID=67331 RepID=UPI00094409C3|nr:hypothetical protein [Streptomyces misionensis]
MSTDRVDAAAERLMGTAQYFFPGSRSADRRVLYREGGRNAEEFHRERWRHDREGRAWPVTCSSCPRRGTAWRPWTVPRCC